FIFSQTYETKYYRDKNYWASERLIFKQINSMLFKKTTMAYLTFCLIRKPLIHVYIKYTKIQLMT
ncbi:MAG: hypothetical protein ACPGSM_06755, partial [Thiolinea sp.]